MITPAYAPTATERVLPRLALDFTTASLDPRVTITRALNTATRINSSGFIESVNADLPRFDYTLNSGGACKGLLIEETRINILREAVTMDGTSWLKTASGGGSAPVPTLNAGTSPDGTNNATKYVFSAPVSGDVSSLQQTAFTSSAGNYTGGFYVKAFDAADVGKVIGFRHVASGAYMMVTLTANWTRVTKTETRAASDFNIVLRPQIGTSSGTVSILVYGGQLELGDFATSLIPNTGTGTVTRNADQVTMTGTNFSSWYNASEGTFVAGLSSVNRSGGTQGFSVGGFSNGMYCLVNTGGNYFNVRSGNVTQASIGAQAYNAGVNTVVCSYKANSFATALNGNAAVTATSGLVPTVSLATLGALGTGNYLNGWVSKFYFYPQQLTLAEMQAFSKG